MPLALYLVYALIGLATTLWLAGDVDRRQVGPRPTAWRSLLAALRPSFLVPALGLMILVATWARPMSAAAGALSNLAAMVGSVLLGLGLLYLAHLALLTSQGPARTGLPRLPARRLRDGARWLD